MSKQTGKKISRVALQSCDKLLEGFFSETLKKQEDLDEPIVNILERLHKEGQLTADNIIRALCEERIKLHE